MVVLGFLCVLLGSRWLLEGAWPETVSSFGTEAGGCLLAAVVFGARAVWERERVRWPGAWRNFWQGWRVFAVALVIAGPALAGSIAARPAGANNGTLALALTPVVVAVACNAFASIETADLMGLLWPGLAGVAGLLLLLPEPSFSVWRSWLAVAMMPILVGNGAVLALAPTREHEASLARGRWWVCGLGSLFASMIFGALQLRAGIGFGAVLRAGWTGGCCLDAAGFVLMLVALEQLEAVRWSALFLLAPLIALLEGVLLLHPVLDVRSWIGLILLAAGACRLLFSTAAAAEEGLGLNVSGDGGVPEA